MAIGIMLPRNISAANVINFARRAEELGFDEVWVVEDLGFRGGIAQTAAVLASTKRIRVGIGILPAGARNAAFDAMELATLEQLYPGRIDAGIGHGMPGWMRSVGAWPKSPLGLLRDHVNVVRGLISGRGVDVPAALISEDPAAVRLDVTAIPTHVPDLLLGVRGPKSLELSGRVAEGTVLAEPVTPEYARAALASIEAGRAAWAGSADTLVAGVLAPKDKPHRVVAYNFGAVADTDEQAIERIRPTLAGLAGPDWAPHIAPLPFAQEFYALFEQCSSPEEFARRVPGEWVLALSLSGTVERVRARIAELEGAGVTSNVFVPMQADAMDALEELAQVL